MHQQVRAYVFAGAAAFLWSTVPAAFKLPLRHVDPLQLVLYANGEIIDNAEVGRRLRSLIER